MPGTIVATKKQAYALAAAGAFGNVIDRSFSIAEWHPKSDQYPLWGVQTSRIPGGPCRLNCPTTEVEETFNRPEFLANAPVISGMITACVPTVWCGDVWDGPLGVTCHGLYRPPLGFNWRKEMLTPKEWRGTAAKVLLETVLNFNSHRDLLDLMIEYPGQVYEISAFDRCVGKVKGRNHLVWEVRAY